MEAWTAKYALAHHGILGQKWGKRNGPPYPLDAENHSSSEKKAGWRKSLNGKTGRETVHKDGTGDRKEKSHLSDKQKKWIKVGAIAVGTALAAYGGYKVYESGALDKFAEFGKNKASGFLAGGASMLDFEESKPSARIRKLSSPESFSDTLSRANPLKGTQDGLNNCVPSAIAGFLRQAGYDVSAKSTKGQMQNTAGVVEECFRGAKVLEGSATKFGRSRADAAEMLLKRYGQNAEGLCAIDWKGGKGGHCFGWKIKDGIVSFFDCSMGRDDSVVSRYWNTIDPNGQLVLARLDGLEIDMDAISKYVD